MVMSLFQHVPNFHNEEAIRLARNLYGVSCAAKELPSERDQNFLLTSDTGERFVFKIANSLEQLPFLEAQNAAMVHLESRVSFCPRVISAQSGKQIEQTFLDGLSHFVRLVTFISGEPIANVKPTSKLRFDFGKKLGEVTRALSSFDHPAFHREFHWDMVNATKVVRQFEELLTPASLREQVVTCADDFESAVGRCIDKLPRSVIHGDANDYNVIVEDQSVVGLIDFGDMPSEQLLTEMTKFNEELVNAGVMLAGEGLHPSSKAKRVKFSGPKRIVTDGPFAETRELIAGFWIWKVKSMEEAVEWVKRCPNPVNGESDIDIRPIFEAEDFGAELTPEVREREERLRSQIEKQGGS